MRSEEPKANNKKLHPLVRLVNALITSLISLFAYYTLMTLLFTERTRFFYDPDCFIACLSLLETITDPFLFKGAVFVFIVSCIFGLLYWQKNLLKSLYEKHIKSS